MKIKLTGVAALVAFAGLTASVHAQDSTASIAGNTDALSSYDLTLQRVSYVVDLTGFTGSWGTAYYIGPVLKASLDNDPMFSTQIAGSAAVSPDVLTGVSFGSTNYALWTTSGAGVNPAANTAPGSVAVTGFDRQFGVGLSDLSAAATNVIGATVGQNNNSLGRLYVSRTVASQSRNQSTGTDCATLALGSIDASGNVYFRADDFNSPNTAKVLGDNVARVDLAARNIAIRNRLGATGSINGAGDTSATTFLVNNGTNTLNTPAAIPDTASTNPFGVLLDFANKYRPDGGAGVSTHLASGIDSHRGNPSFHGVTTFGGVGAAASLARSGAASPVDSVNVFALNATGGVVATAKATLAAGVTDAVSGATRNAAGNSEFKQYLSQVSFRGGNGQVGLGFDSLRSLPIATAVATDPAQGEFVAVARMSGTPTWTIAAHVGKTILNGPSGTSIGAIVSTAPATFSAPAADLMGNVYFIATYQPTGGGPVKQAFIKGVNSLTGYRLERIVESGQSFAGANSSRTYTIDKLTLADSDSVASGTFHSGQILQPQIAGQNPSDPASQFAFGGAAVNATIIYDNGGTPEDYQVTLWVGPRDSVPPPSCPGDANGDGDTNGADLSVLLAQFGSSVTPNTGGDFNGDGQVNGADLSVLLGNFGCNN